MKILFLTLFAAIAGGCASSSAPRLATPPLANLQAVAIPDFDSDRGIQWSSTREEYEAARADQRFELSQFTYQSDGLTVGAYLYGPRARSQRRLPIIVYNRGSFTRPNGFAGEMLVMAHRYAEAGFIVVAPHYRGSNGWAGKDELGGAEVHDLTNIARELGAIDGADASRVFLAGESRGGAMVYIALRDGFPARAAAVWGAFTDLGPLIAPGGPQAQYAPMIWPDIAEHRDAIIQSRSAIRFAKSINKPILIMHGGADEDIPVVQSQSMDAELTKLGKVHKLMVFDGQYHRIGGRGAERDAATVAWFRKYGVD